MYKGTKIKGYQNNSYVVMVWLNFFQFFSMVMFMFFSHWYFLKKDEIVALTLMCKNMQMQKVTWRCHGISPWMRDCIIDCSRQNSVARMQFIHFFATFWLWPISICFTKLPQSMLQIAASSRSCKASWWS